MNLIESKEEPERAFYLRLLGNCGVPQPQLSHPSATSTEGHRPRNTHQGFSPLQYPPSQIQFLSSRFRGYLVTRFEFLSTFATRQCPSGTMLVPMLDLGNPPTLPDIVFHGLSPSLPRFPLLCNMPLRPSRWALVHCRPAVG
jgi:hypothetical protein